MNPSPAILNELKELSPLLAGMDRVNVFTVPEGYFESLEIVLMAGIATGNAALDQHIGMPDQSVPPGYFDGLAGSILAKVKALDESATGEIAGLSPLLAGLQQHNVFTVPNGYFEALPAKLVAQLSTTELNAVEEISELSPVLAGLQNKNVFTVPGGYFETVAGRLLAQLSTTEATAAAELRALSPLLYSIQGENVFTVPRGYFEGLAGEINEKLKPAPAKVITLRKRSNTFLKYAVAAVFTGVMALGVFKFTGDKKVTLDDTVVAGLQIAKEKKVDEEINKLTDADIVKYLQSNGENIDMTSVTNLIDEKKLPEQTDYLMDEQALDKYLDGLTTDDLKN